MSVVLQFRPPLPWDQVARAMQRALQVDRRVIFPGDELMPVSLPELARVPYLGWVGPRFSGTVIVAKNPGGGGDSQNDVKPYDRAVADALLALKTAPAEHLSSALHQVYDAFTLQAPSIGMGTLLGRVLNALGDEREQVAFLNLCPYRTRMDKDPPVAAVRRSAESVLAPLVWALQADSVVLLGGFASRAAPTVEIQLTLNFSHSVLNSATR